MLLSAVFDPVAPIERVPFSIDFSNQLPSGDTLTGTPQATLTVYLGDDPRERYLFVNDPNASALLWGSPAINGAVVTQWVGPGFVADAVYQLTLTATTAAGATFSISARFRAGEA